MDVADLKGWLVALIALAGLLIQVRSRSKDTSRINMQEALKPINEQLERFGDHHATHFQDINALTVRIARNEERVTAHEADCSESRQRTEGMLREIRDDVKDILKQR